MNIPLIQISDGHPETIPVVMWGTQSGNRYPAIVGPDNLLYQSNILENRDIPQGKVMAWKIGTPDMSLVGGQGAVDEPQAISGGGNTIYRNICCDRVADWFKINSNQNGSLWDYSRTLTEQAPGYDELWWGTTPGDPVRLHGNYGTVNGIYHNHGDQNPLIPYMGSLFTHRSNAIIAYGTGQVSGKLPLLTISSGNAPAATLTPSDVQNQLNLEVQKILDAGPLRPGYYNSGQFSVYSELADYFDNPGDTLLTLSEAYPHLPASTQTQLRSYLQVYFQTYFNPVMYSITGWDTGASRDWMPLPPEVTDVLPRLSAKEAPGPRFSWQYPPQNIYGMWKYAQIVPQNASQIYALAKSKLAVPVPAMANTEYFRQKPYELNAYIAGYVGFLELQNMAGMAGTDAPLRTRVNTEMNRLEQLRVSIFSKDTYWVDNNYHKRSLNIARNFIWLVPELGNYLRSSNLSHVSQAVDEYESTAPNWFVSRYEAIMDEGVMSPLYNSPALFQAKAYILEEPQGELLKYLDVPAFARGDLFYIQNLVATLDAQPWSCQ